MRRTALFCATLVVVFVLTGASAPASQRLSKPDEEENDSRESILYNESKSAGEIVSLNLERRKLKGGRPQSKHYSRGRTINGKGGYSKGGKGGSMSKGGKGGKGGSMSKGG